MNMNTKELDVFYNCQKKISFVASVFSQETLTRMQLDEDALCGFVLLIAGVLRDLELIEKGAFSDQ